MAGAQGADPEVLKKKIHIYIGRNRLGAAYLVPPRKAFDFFEKTLEIVIDIDLQSNYNNHCTRLARVCRSTQEAEEAPLLRV